MWLYLGENIFKKLPVHIQKVSVDYGDRVLPAYLGKVLEKQTLRKSHAMEKNSFVKQTPEYHLCGGETKNRTRSPECQPDALTTMLPWSRYKSFEQSGCHNLPI